MMVLCEIRDYFQSVNAFTLKSGLFLQQAQESPAIELRVNIARRSEQPIFFNELRNSSLCSE